MDNKIKVEFNKNLGDDVLEIISKNKTLFGEIEGKLIKEKLTEDLEEIFNETYDSKHARFIGRRDDDGGCDGRV